MVWLLVAATIMGLAYVEPYRRPTPFRPNYYPPRYSQPQKLIASPPAPAPAPAVIEVGESAPAFIPGPPLPGPPAPPLGFKCPICTGPDCCELCAERSCTTPEDLSLLELALNPFFYVQYVEDCAQAQFLDNICTLFVPLLDLSSLFTFAQIITFQDGTVEQRQYQVECVDDAYQFYAIGSGCKFRFEVIYADILCGVYIFQRCYENACCMIDSGPIQIVTTALPAGKQCLCEALEYAQKLFPCKVFIELPQENASLCTVLGNTLVPKQG